MKEMIESVLEGVYTMMPAIITKVYKSGNFVDVIPTIKKDNATIEGVPIVYPCSGNFTFRFRMKVGDEVVLIHSKYPLDTLFGREEVKRVDAARGKEFTITNCVAIPALRLFDTGIDDFVDAELYSDNASITFTDNELVVEADTPITITSESDVTIDSADSVKLSSIGSVAIKSETVVRIESAVDMSLTAPTLNIKSDLINISGNTLPTSAVLLAGTINGTTIPQPI